jgi:hypothetical protein
MIINFECKTCKLVFDCDVGKIGVNMKTFRPDFEKKINCPKCGNMSIDQVFLTELGQSQMTKATM